MNSTLSAENFATTMEAVTSTASSGPTFPKKYESYIIYIIYMRGWDIVGYINYVSFFIKIPVFIFFCYHFIKKTKKIYNVYFCFLLLGFFWDIIDSVIYTSFVVCTHDGNECYWLMRANKLSLWYNTDFSGIWTIVLTINRLSAILWWNKYDEIWSKYFKACIIFLSIYPFLIHGYSFIQWKCRLELVDEVTECPGYWLEDANVTAISSGIVAVIAFITDMTTVAIYRIKIKKDTSLKNNPDKKLIFQALVSSITFALYTAIITYWTTLWKALSDTNKIGAFYTVLYFSMHASYISFHLSAYVMIFFISPILRKHLLKFYRITWLYQFMGAKFHVTPISNNSITRSTTLTAVVSHHK